MRWYKWREYKLRHLKIGTVKNLNKEKFTDFKIEKIDWDVHWMVDHSSKVIGVYTGAPGGTKETIEYAKKNGREVVVINRYK